MSWRKTVPLAMRGTLEATSGEPAAGMGSRPVAMATSSESAAGNRFMAILHPCKSRSECPTGRGRRYCDQVSRRVTLRLNTGVAALWS